MRATATGLAAAVLVLAASSAHAQPAFLLPQNCVPPNPIHYGPGACRGCWYGPNYCFQGPCLPGQPFNGILPVKGQAPGYAAAPGGMPGAAPPGMPPGVQPYPGMPGYTPPGVCPPPGFATHPFARSPRDFFMYGQQWTE